jgi:hypothetical protein
VSLTLDISLGSSELTIRIDASDVVLGRSSRCDVRLPHADVSGRHVHLVRNGPHWTVEDLDSRNGTKMDGEPLQPRVARSLTDGSELELAGVVRLRAHMHEPDGDTLTLTESGTLSRLLLADQMTGPIEAYLSTGDERVAVPNSAHNLRVSGDGFRIDRAADGFRLTPLRDCTVDGEPVRRGGVILRDGASIRCEGVLSTFHDPLQQRLAGLDDAEFEPGPLQTTEKVIVGFALTAAVFAAAGLLVVLGLV